VVFVIALGYQARLTADVIHGFKVTVPYFTLGMASAEIEAVSSEAGSAGLKVGDELLAVNGRPYKGTAVLAQEEMKAVPGTSLTLTIRGRNQSRPRTIDLPVSGSLKGLGSNSVPIILLVVLPSLCLLLAYWVVLARPRDRLAWLLFGMLLSFTQVLGGAATFESWAPGMREVISLYHIGLATTWPIFMFLFGFYFPEPFSEGDPMRRWAKVAWILIAPLLPAAIIDAVIKTAQISSYASIAGLYRWTGPFLKVAGVCSYIATSGFFCFIFMKSSAASNLPPDARRRLRLLYWGATISMMPVLIVSIISAVTKIPFELIPQWALYPSLLMLMLFPLTLAYVIVVQRAMDVRVVVRQGLQYGLAQRGIRAVQIGLTATIIIWAFNTAQGRGSGPVGSAVLTGIVIGVLFTIRRAADKLRTWTDRRFFREAYNAEQVLSELSDHVRGMVETRPLIETVAGRISEVLHIPQVAVLLENTGPYRPAYAIGYSSVPDVAFASNAGAVRVLETQKDPPRVYFDDPGSWLYHDPEVSEEDRAKLALLHAELLLPLKTRDRLLGFISLGAKRSDEPYSGTDVRLLKSVAAQTGLALENARLMSAIADEVAQRERLNREVEIAREVQERLFPQTLPPIAGIDYAGACRPALGVGGDYYDFLALPGGQLGIAIGDVSGKGIAAALMMASLQASLRGEATRAPENLAGLVSNINRLVYEASAANRYATFFYAQYNPATLELTYVNAGHNPPLLFHGSTGDVRVSRLETGGTVVGLLESFPYQQATEKLAPGDIFVAFTDGISEAMNDADEEWGEDCLEETVKCCAQLSAAGLIQRVMQAADTFVAGAAQHDDMTLVVLRCAP